MSASEDRSAARRRAVFGLAGVIAFAYVALKVEAAAEFPTKPIRLIVPYPPGGGNDTVARAIAVKMGESLGKPVVVDNRAGANGMIAAEAVARAEPDGYTLLMANISSHGINPSLYKKVPYDAVHDFAAVSLVAVSPNVLVVRPALKLGTLKDLVAYAKANPGKLTYGSNGSGSSQHLAGALFCESFNVKLVHVPYKGTGPMMNDLLGGQIDMSFGSIIPLFPHVKSKALVPLAVTTAKRSSLLPEVPTVAETVPGFDATVWWGIVTTRGVPKPVVDVLNREVRKAIDAPQTRAQLANSGAEPKGSTPQQFDAFIQSELTKWAQVVKDTGATAD